MMATEKSVESSFIKQEHEDVTCGDETIINNNCNEGLMNENIHIKNEFVKVELDCSFEKPETKIINNVDVNLENSKKRSIKLYMCHVCGFATKIPSRLQEHKNSHKNIVNPDESNASNISENKSCNSESTNGIFLEIDNLSNTCKICGKEFAKTSLLKNHMSVHTTKRDFKCHICHRAYKLHARLQRHLHTHAVSCTLCKHRFAQYNLLKIHLTDVHGINSHEISKYVCRDRDDESFASIAASISENEKKICLGADEISKASELQEENVENNSLLKLDLSEKQVTIRCYMCDTCNKAFSARSRLRRHLFTHMTKGFECEVCNNRFSQTSSLRRHMQNLHKVSPQDKINYKCFDSGVDNEVLTKMLTNDTPSTRLTLTINPEVKQEVSIEVDRFSTSCKICGRKCRNNNVLRNHMFVHTTKRPFKCSICNKAYKVHATLRRHLATHMEKRFECNICKKRFIERSSLRRHMRTFHDPYSSEKSVHNCDSCHKTFTTLARYERHSQLHGNPNTECPVCSKVFHGLSQLKVHMRIHSGEKPFTCEICHVSFTFKHVLISHQERVHQLYTRHKCNVCSILFRTKTELIVHTTTHVLSVPCTVESSKYFRPIKGDKITYYSMLLPYLNLKGNPNKCNECAESFVTRRSYMNHVIRHIVSEFQILAKIPSYDCRICKQANFRGEIHFKRHLRRHVQLPKCAFKCESCGKTFHSSAKYTKHKNTHREYFQCDYCRKRFHEKYLLIDHMEEHSERPFIKCIYCEKIFHDTANFLKHFETFHEEKMSAEEFLNDEDDLVIVA